MAIGQLTSVDASIDFFLVMGWSVRILSILNAIEIGGSQLSSQTARTRPNFLPDHPTEFAWGCRRIVPLFSWLADSIAASAYLKECEQPQPSKVHFSSLPETVRYATMSIASHPS